MPRENGASPELSVGKIGVGDRFLWCDRAVTVVDTKPCDTGSWSRPPRPSRYLICDVGGEDVLQLHYYNDERVTLIEAAHA
jgi:hypothetical protein